MNFSYKWNLEDLKEVNPNGLKVFSCFSGSGGSTMGYKMAGYNTVGALEIDKENDILIFAGKERPEILSKYRREYTDMKRKK